jgi:hypothetical protein
LALGIPGLLVWHERLKPGAWLGENAPWGALMLFGALAIALWRVTAYSPPAEKPR